MMTKSKLVVLAVIGAAGGIMAHSWGEKSEPLAPVAAEAPKDAPTPAPAPPQAAAPTPAANPDSQTDEGAGKAVDIAKVGSSPKDMSSPYLGDKDAPVVVNVFSDFQCPVCRRSADPIKQLVADFPGKVKVVFRNNALSMHSRSKAAALAAWAAKKQGRFWEFHDKLFGTGQLDDASLESNAEGLGLDMARWKQDISDPKNTARIEEEADWAKQMGAQSTPSFFINGQRAIGWGSYLGLRSLVQREIDTAAKSGASVKDRILAMASKNTKSDDKDPPIDPQNWAKILTHD